MRVMGIDPGVATTGFAVVERAAGRMHVHAVGAVRTASDDRPEQRLFALHADLGRILATHKPDCVAIERVFFNANVRTAMSVGQGAGVALLAAAQHGVPVTDYTPTEVKLSVAGTGVADKDQVSHMVAAILKLDEPPSPADAADACALAICHLNRSGLARAVDPGGGRRAARRLARAIEAAER